MTTHDERGLRISRRTALGALVLSACRPATAESPRPLPPPAPVPTAPIAPLPRATPEAKAPPTARDIFGVASENPAIVEAATRVLEEGGNAIDAAIVAALVGGVTQPASTGLGGDGFATVWLAKTEQPLVIDFRATSPHGLRRADHLRKSTPKKRRGVMVGVPGLVRGLMALHEKGGRTPWSTLVLRAADLAESGAAMSPYLAGLVAWHFSELAEDPKSPFHGQSARPAQEWIGQSLAQPNLAAALRTIAKSPEDFYEGALAKDYVEKARAFGSRLVLADMRGYRAIVREPLRVRWGDLEMLAPPPPSGGGLTLLQVLTMFPPNEVLDIDTPSPIHALAEALRLSLADREAFVGDPDFTKVALAELLDPARLAERRRRIRDDVTTLPKFPSISDGGTLHLSVVDQEGNAVSLTTTLGSSFGSRIAASSGFFLNDASIDFAMDEYGQRPMNKGGNFPRGGARPQSSMTPLIGTRKDEVSFVLGASGGLRSVTAPLQVLIRATTGNMELARAVSQPRFHVAPSGALSLDARQESLASDLRARGEIVDVGRPDFGAISVISVDKSGPTPRIFAAGDSRRAGASFVGKATTP